MDAGRGRTIPLSLPRKWMDDFLHAARKAHTLFDLCHNKTKKNCIEKVAQSIGR